MTTRLSKEDQLDILTNEIANIDDELRIELKKQEKLQQQIDRIQQLIKDTADRIRELEHDSVPRKDYDALLQQIKEAEQEQQKTWELVNKIPAIYEDQDKTEKPEKEAELANLRAQLANVTHELEELEQKVNNSSKL